MNSLVKILTNYSGSYKAKLFLDESPEIDDLMLIFGLSQLDKAQNKQYWGRELGKCWELLVIEICKQTHTNFGIRIKEGASELCDLVLGKDAIDTKYRIGSGDAGTLKKFKQNGIKLRDLGYNPIMLILRNDNLPAAITQLKTGGWTVIVGDASYAYIRKETGFDLQAWLKTRKLLFLIEPQTDSSQEREVNNNSDNK